MADELGAVLEAPEVVADGAVEQQGEVATEQTEQPDKPLEVTESEEVKGDERLLPKWMRELKASNPDAFKEARTHFFRMRTFDDKLKDFDLDGTKSFLEEHGGRESIVSTITDLRGKAEQFDGLMQKIEVGDTEVLKDIPAESLAKLAPAVAEQWKQADPEGWEAAMSTLFAATIEHNRIPAFLERLSLNLEFGKTEEVAKMVDQLKGWAGSFADKAQAPRTQPAKQATQGKDDVKSEREQWETEKFTTSVKSEVDNFRTPLIEAQLKPFIARRAGDTDAQQLAKSTVVNQVIDRMAADKDFQKALNGLMARKDKDGAMRLIKSRETTAINEIAPKVGRMIFGNPAPEKKPEAEKKPDTQTARRPAQPQTRQDPKDAILQRIFSR